MEVFPFFLLLLATKYTSINGIGSCKSISSMYDNETMWIKCEGHFFEFNDLQEALPQLLQPMPTTVNFHLKDVSVDVLPPNMFSNISSVKRLILEDSSVKFLNLPVSDNNHPLELLKDDLQWLEIYGSSGIYSWDWSAVPTLKNLQNLVIDNTKVISLPKHFDFAVGLRLVEITRAEIEFLHPLVFRNHSELVFFSLAQNRIRHVERSMFPDPASKLWSLDLSFNRIEKLPKNIFDGMNSLNEVKLDGNLLKSIDALKPAKLWNRISQVWLQNNPLICYALCWMDWRTYRPWILDSAKCYLRGSVRGENIYVPLKQGSCNNFKLH